MVNSVTCTSAKDADAKRGEQVQPESSFSCPEENDSVVERFVTFPIAVKRVSSTSRSWEDDDGIDFHADEKHERHSTRFSEEAEEFVYNGAESSAVAKYRRRRRRLQEPATCADDDESCLTLPIDAVGELMESVMSSMETMLCKMSCLE